MFTPNDMAWLFEQSPNESRWYGIYRDDEDYDDMAHYMAQDDIALAEAVAIHGVKVA